MVFYEKILIFFQEFIDKNSKIAFFDDSFRVKPKLKNTLSSESPSFKSFTFFNESSCYKFISSNHSDMCRIFELLRDKVTFKGFNNIFRVIKKIGVGGCSKVFKY